MLSMFQQFLSSAMKGPVYYSTLLPCKVLWRPLRAWIYEGRKLAAKLFHVSLCLYNMVRENKYFYPSKNLFECELFMGLNRLKI